MRSYLDDMEDLDPVEYPDENEIANTPPPPEVRPDDSSFAYAEPQSLSPRLHDTMQPEHVDYLKDKYNIGEREKLIDQNKKDASGPDWGAALAAIGAGFQHKDSGAAARAVKQMNESKRNQKLADFDKSRVAAVEEKKYGVDQEKARREADPNSIESQSAQQLALKMGVNPDIVKNLTAAKFKGISPSFTKMYEMDQRAADRKEARETREAMLEATLGRKREEAAKPSEKQVDAFTDFDNAESDLNNMLTGLGSNSNWVGPVDGRISDALVGNDQVAWRSAVGKFKDAYRKAVTGAGASVQEIARLESRLPSETDTIANFKAKANEAVKNLQEKRKIYASNLTKGGKNVSNFAEGSSSGYPKQVRKGNQAATVSNEQEEQEAMSEGFQ